MIIYWGYPSGGKTHMRNYAILNSKTWLSWAHNGYWIRKRESKVNYHEGVEWIDLNINHIYYHKNKNYNNLLSNSYSENKIERYGGIRGYMCNKSSNISKESIMKDRNLCNKISNSIEYKQEHVEKYTKKEYLNTLIYHEMLCNHRKKFCEKNLTNDILEKHYDEIFDNVDLITHTYMWSEEIVKNILHILRKANNIVPYKSNKLHQTITFLDEYPVGRNFNFYNDYRTPRGRFDVNECGKLFDAPKEKIWEYLDEWHNDINITISLLKKYDIPFQYFDLDSDSYRDVIGWDKELPRTYSYFDYTWDEEKRKKAEIIAKEYLVCHNIKET